MADDLAPSRSPRPTPRTTPEERRAIDRAAADAMMEEFAALEDRADMDPWLADNPLRRLGYREMGGLRGVDYLPATPEGAYYSAGAVNRIGLGSDYFTPPVQAHEAGHAGVDVVTDAVFDPRNRDYANLFLREGLSPTPSYGFEEAVIELSDNPMDTWIQPRREGRPTGTYSTLEPTIQFLPEAGTSDRSRVERYEQIMQEIAQEELARRGEPPRAVMQQPQPGNIFYREPEPEPRGGLLGLLDRIRGN